MVDLGCGEGALTASLAARWPEARIAGIDSSPEMLAATAAHTIPGRLEFAASDAREWRPAGQIDVLVTNALLHWVPDHAELLSRWAEALSADGWLAMQVPGSFRSPTHTVLADLCRSPRWSEQLGDLAPRTDAVLEPAEYLDVLTGGRVVHGRVGDDLPARADRRGPGPEMGPGQRASARAHRPG